MNFSYCGFGQCDYLFDLGKTKRNIIFIVFNTRIVGLVVGL